MLSCRFHKNDTLFSFMRRVFDVFINESKRRAERTSRRSCLFAAEYKLPTGGEVLISKNILTVRVEDIFEQKCGCPICITIKASEDNSCEYISGSAMMEPDIRIETNRLGFCREHFDMLLKTSQKLPLALILSTHLDEIRAEAFGDTKTALGKRMKRGAEFEKTCYICSRTESDLDRFFHGMFKLYAQDEHFRKLFSEQEYICFPHRNLLLNLAQKALKKDVLRQFCEETERLSENRLVQIRNGLEEFCRSFDYRNIGKQLSENAENAPENAIEFITGKPKKD